MTEPRCHHSAAPGAPTHGLPLPNTPESYVYIFVGDDLVLAFPMCDEHKPQWRESDAYRTGIPPIPLVDIPLPKPKKRKPLSVDGKIRLVLEALIEAKLIKEADAPGLDSRGPLPKPTRDYYYRLERQGLIPEEILLAATT